MRTAFTKLVLGPGVRPRSRAVMELVEDAFARLTPDPRVGSIRFDGYESGRIAVYAAQFRDA